VRGSVSTGFRAPSLGQSFFSSTATNFLSPGPGQGLVPVESLTLPVASAAAQVLGAAALKPERSLNTGAGIVITPLPDLAVTVDFYRIAIDDRIVLSGNFTGPAIAALLAPFGANSARFFTNAIDTRTNGVDVSANYRLPLGAPGDLQLRGGYNNTRTKVVGAIATPPQLASFASVLFDRIEERRIECAQPNDSVRVGGEWRRRRIGVNLNVARYGEYCSTVTLIPADDQEYRPKWLTDVEASYRTAGYSLAVGVQNLFDVFPDRNTTVNSFNGIQTYPSQSPFGMNGRAIYARVGRTF
jgi:iron complex outermembrane receptor protein